MSIEKKLEVDRTELDRVLASRPLAGKLVMGIDPSLNGTGIALIALDAQGAVVAAGAHTIKIPTGLDAVDRIYKIANTIETWIVGCGDFLDNIVIEDLPKTAHSAGLTGQAQGAVRYAIASAEIGTAKRVGVIAVAPATLKKQTTGSGRADKEQMKEGVYEYLGTKLELEDDNQADASALALIAVDVARGTFRDVAHSLVRAV